MIIQESLKHSMTYHAYLKLINDLLIRKKSTGHIQSELLTSYSKLNMTRMNRLNKTTTITPENIKKLQGLSQHYIWLVLSEGWCGDAAQILPILNKMAILTNHIQLKILLRDDNDTLMNAFLTHGSKAIPKLIILEKNTQKILTHWGPRPKGANDLILHYKKEFGVIDDIARTALQKWYLKDKGISIQHEVLHVITE